MTHAYMQDLPKSARAMGKDLPISPKVAIELCSFLRGKNVDTAVQTLKRVQKKAQAVPYRRFGSAAGHKSGMAAGRYPIKAAGEFLKLLENAKANASNAGLTGDLVITHLAANRASEPFRNRAKFRVTFKRTHVEVALTEHVKEEKKTTRAAKTKTAHTAKAEVTA
jgi:large subunit ribosomal protein L22